MKYLRRYILCLVCCLSFVFLNRAGWSQADSTIFEPDIAALMSRVSANNIEMHIKNLAEADGHHSRVSFTEGNRWAAEYIRQSFESFPGLTTVAFDTFFAADAPSPYDTIPLVNVAATLAAKGDSSPYYLVGGHLDATGNLDPNLDWDNDWPTAAAAGADDNASGIAAILEIARVLSDPAHQFKPKTTLKFVAFGAEERHPAYNKINHLGSRHFARRAYNNGDDILGVYILDMIGYNNTGNHYFNIVSNNNSKDLGSKMLEVNRVYQLGLDSNAEPFPQAIYSDHDQFWAHLFRAILIIENAPPWEDNSPWYSHNPFYHRESDTPATVNFEQVARIARLTLGTVATLTDAVTGIAARQAPGLAPKTFTLLQNYPNPFNPATTIRYQLFFSGEVELTVYNLAGQKIATLVQRRQPAGEYSLVWEARDDQGNALTSGLYMLRLKFDGQYITRKMLVIK